MKLVLAVVVSLVIAACGGTTETVDTSIVPDPEPVVTTAPESEPAATTAPVDEPVETETMAEGIAAAETALGSVLVDDGGRTLYIFTNDQGSESVCYDGCETAWPVVAAGASASDGLDLTLGSTPRTNGGEQLTINGRPVYLFSGDANPGDVNGQGSGGVWFVIGTDGEPITS